MNFIWFTFVKKSVLSFKNISIHSNKIKREGNRTPSNIRKKIWKWIMNPIEVILTIFEIICISWFIVFLEFSGIFKYYFPLKRNKGERIEWLPQTKRSWRIHYNIIWFFGVYLVFIFLAKSAFTALDKKIQNYM